MSPSRVVYSRQREPRVVLIDIHKNEMSIAKTPKIETYTRAHRSKGNEDSNVSRCMIYRGRNIDKITSSRSSLQNISAKSVDTTKNVPEKRKRGRPRKIDKKNITESISRRTINDSIDKCDESSTPVPNPVWPHVMIKSEFNTEFTETEAENIYNPATIAINVLEQNNNIVDLKEVIPAVDNVEIKQVLNGISTRGDNIGEIFDNALTKLVRSIDCLTEQIIELRNGIQSRGNN